MRNQVLSNIFNGMSVRSGILLRQGKNRMARTVAIAKLLFRYDRGDRLQIRLSFSEQGMPLEALFCVHRSVYWL